MIVKDFVVDPAAEHGLVVPSFAVAGIFDHVPLLLLLLLLDDASVALYWGVSVVVVVVVAVTAGFIFGIPPVIRGRLFKQTDTLDFSDILTFGKLCTFGFVLKQAVLALSSPSYALMR